MVTGRGRNGDGTVTVTGQKRWLRCSKIVRASKISKNLFTFDGANNVNDKSDSEEEDEEEKKGN